MVTKQMIIEIIFRYFLIFVTNFLILLNIIVNIVRYGREYLESPHWFPMPEILDDPKFGQHKIAHLKNINLHYVESGDEDKPLMLLVHGFPEFWYSWHHQIMEFQKDFRVVAVDLRGYGRSDKPQDVASYSTDILVEDLRQLMEHLGAPKCTLVGHDWGGAIVWQFAQDHPDLLSRLVVMNAPHKKAFADVLEKNKKQIMCSWYMFFFQMPWIPEWYTSRMSLDFIERCFVGKDFGLQKSTFSENQIKCFKANMVQPGVLTASINFYRAAFRHRSKRGGGMVEVPTLLIWGTEDKALTIGIPKACEKYCKDITVKYMNGASHWVQQDMPVEVNAAMREFFASK